MDPLDAIRWESARFGYGIRLGTSSGEVAFAAPELGSLVIGPPRCGKTSSVVVPNVLAACGPVIATSTKRDVLAATAAARTRVGECLLFDPGGKTPVPAGVHRVAWSPLTSSREWDGATLIAETMVLTARPGGERGEAYHWTERAQALLAPAFHAAALDEMGMTRLVSIVDRREGRELSAVLARHDSGMPLDTLQGVLETDERELSGIWSTASSILAAYRSERALASSSGPLVDFDRFIRDGNTLYVCSGSEEQRHGAPIVGGLLRDARVAAYTAAGQGELGHASKMPPLLLVLDEVANIAPLHDLPALVSEGASQGVVTLACLQDLSQAIARWGRVGEGFLSLFNTKVIFPGIGDTRTLEALSVLGGEHEVRSVSVTDGARLAGLPGLFGRCGPGRTTLSTRKERRLPVDLIAQGAPGHVLCFDGAVPSFVESKPWFEERSLSAAARSSSVELGLDRAPELGRSPRHMRGFGR
ncbi:MAG: type IV secretory system conjugative DNA transfer family protein [Acidimicrobiales bacterium]